MDGKDKYIIEGEFHISGFAGRFFQFVDDDIVDFKFPKEFDGKFVRITIERIDHEQPLPSKPAPSVAD